MEIVVIGAGIIGLATAWRTAARGAAVTLVDPDPCGGATAVAAGMLAPVGELAYGEEELLRLGLESRGRYPDFVAELEEQTGLNAGYHGAGLVQVAYDADDFAQLTELRTFQESLGIPVVALTGREARELEPMLAPGVRGGLFAADDGSVDPRLLAPALLAAAEKLGARVVRRRAAEVIVTGGRAAGVRLDDGTELSADRVLLAAGAWSGDVGGLPPGTLPPVRPVKGQVLRLRARGPFLTRTVRGLVRGSHVYLVPRADGEIVVGATQEELGFDDRVTAGGLWELLRDARDLVPGVTELEFAEVRAGLRPGSPDNAPVMGAAEGVPGLVLATGHFRNGVLLAPVSADVLTAALLDGTVPDVGVPFLPSRF
ncbi:glycine oxidase ThiO [Actinomadura flavalba]|uniref:glycine oxidase ThiO n=1 Tax=Actinomadura flavalba TaxID=1120938 RepID=UPI0003677D51|nr:glycine oxidase ThiO [Actinomadura flavalba]